MRQNARVENIALNKGISRNPSIGEAGELSTCVGLIPRGGELKPIELPVDTGIFLPQPGSTSSYNLMAVHDVGTEKHYLVRWNDVVVESDLRVNYQYLGWYNGEEDCAVTQICSSKASVDTIKSIQTTGNVLLLLWASGTKQYFIWRDGEYQDLGEGIPDIDVQFGLKAELIAGSPEHSVRTVLSNKQVTEYTALTTVTDTTNARYTFHSLCIYTYKAIDLSGTPLLPNTPYRFINPTSEGLIVVVGSSASMDYLAIPPGEWRGIDSTGSSQNVTTILCGIVKNSYGHTFTVQIEEGTTAQNKYVIDNTEDSLTSITAAANELLGKIMTEDSKFAMPFFARAGIRMYDGSIVNLSPPALMLPNAGNAPFVFTSNIRSAGTYPLTACAYSCDLQYKISQEDKAKLALWGDLIKGITIAITPAIYTYNQGYEFDANKVNFKTRDLRTKSIDSVVQVVGLEDVHSDSGIEVDEMEGSTLVTKVKYGWRSIAVDAVENGILSYTTGINYNQVVLPSFEADDVYKKFTEAGSFYVLQDIKTDDIVENAFTAIDTEERDLTGVAAWEQVVEDVTRNDVLGGITYDYNSRLHLGNISEKIWKGETPYALKGYSNGQDTYYTFLVRTIVKIVKNGQEVYADSGTIETDQAGIAPYWFYYPDPDAVSATIYISRKISGVYVFGREITIELKKHDFLNGAFWFESLSRMRSKIIQPSQIGNIVTRTVTGDTLYYPNRLYVSDAANPFVFRTSSSVTIGSGKLLALSVATQALSQGQFGQFPLYAFCSDGIWALEMSINGLYSSAKPLSRDVLTNPTSVTQLDDSVAFTTEKGLMILSGSKAECISDDLNGYVSDDSFITTSLDNFESLLSGVTVDYLGMTQEFRSVIGNAMMIYDYAHKLLHVIPTTDNLPEDPHYVYSIETGQWGTQTFSGMGLLEVVPGYPESYLHFYASQKLYAFRNTANNTLQPCYALTRAIPFGDPYTRKLLCDLRMIGQQTGDGHEARRIAVYVSDDNVSWERLTSLNKRSAKYYRFLVMGWFSPSNSFSGITAQVVDKYVNKFR